jgi:glycerate kinase
MRLLIAPDKFKGSLTALEAAQAIERGFLRASPQAVTVPMPIADGGEGTAEAICAALGGKWITLGARDPLGREIEARYAWLEGDIAVIDMSEASGLWRLAANERDPLRASTYGTGQLMADALRRGAQKILVGLGGSATNDGGIGMAAALGFQFFGSAGEPLAAIPANFAALSRIQPRPTPMGAEIVALCDVGNPLTGERGASRVFGPQKGGSPLAVEELDAGLGRLADLVARDLGCDPRDTPGAGAAGGLGFGLLSFCGAEIGSGFETVAGILHLEEQVAASDLVITGEGRLDAQTLEGKGPAGVAALARSHGKPVIAFAGAVAEEPRLGEVFQETYAITPAGMPLDDAMRNATSLLEESAFQAARRWVQAHPL